MTLPMYFYELIRNSNNDGYRLIRGLTEEEFFLKVDEGLADVEAGKYMISEFAETEIAAEFGLA